MTQPTLEPPLFCCGLAKGLPGVGRGLEGDVITSSPTSQPLATPALLSSWPWASGVYCNGPQPPPQLPKALGSFSASPWSLCSHRYSCLGYRDTLSPLGSAGSCSVLSGILFIGLSICLSIYPLSTHLSVHPSISPSLCLYPCLIFSPSVSPNPSLHLP